MWRGFGRVTHLTGAPNGPQSKTVSVYLRGMNGDRVLGSDGKPGSQSEGKLGTWAGGEGDCDKPLVAFEDTCEGVDIKLENKGAVPAEFTGASKVGDGPFKSFEEPVTVAPGKTAAMFIKGVEGLVVRVTSGEVTAEHAWAAPATCSPATPSPEPTPPPGGGGSGPDEPTLPTTGASITILAVGALALVGAGAGMLALARRRRAVTANGVDGGHV